MRSPLRLALTVASAIAAAVGAPVAAQTQLAGQPAPADALATTNPELVFEPIAACRAFDTHVSSALTAARSFTISGAANLKTQGGPKGGCGVPVSAAAVAISLGTSDASQSGTIAAYPSGKPATNNMAAAFAPSLQLVAGSIVGINNHQLTLAPNGGSVQVTGDVTGYYAPQIEGNLNGDGSIFSSTARVVSVNHGLTGVYSITMDREVADCAISLAPNRGFVSLYGYTLSDELTVHTFDDSSGTPTPADEQFSFSVHC